MKKTISDGFCMILGEPCFKECNHHYYRESNGCWKGEQNERKSNRNKQQEEEHP